MKKPSKAQTVLFLKRLAIGVGALFALLFIALIIEMQSWVKLDLSKIDNLKQSSVFYDSNGNEIAQLAGSENRRKLPLSEVHDITIKAFLAAEDARFYDHFGVDIWRIGGAIVKNLQTNTYSQGASTITQQLVKLTHLTNEKKITRKLQEAWLAIKLERKLSKDEILESYLNLVYFGNGAYGIEAASNVYFDKSASQLTLSESALLAAIIKSPSNYAPHIKPENALKRRNLVLSEMLEFGYITQNEADAAKSEPIVLTDKQQELGKYGWFIDAASDEACAMLGITQEELISGGYSIYTTLDTKWQDAADAIIKNTENFPPNAGDNTLVQTSLVAMTPSDGEILALIGGREYTVRRGLNRATQMKRQPGSAIKPFAVYAPAIEMNGFTPISFINDAPTNFDGYKPTNTGDTYNGTLPMRTALAKSSNVSAVSLLNEIGPSVGLASVQRFGMSIDKQDEVLPLALGSMTYGVTPVELCQAYGALANNGMLVKAHTVRRITLPGNEEVFKHTSTATQATTAKTASMLNSMLTSVIDYGTGKVLNDIKLQIAGKTGSVAMEGGNRDAWMAAYTPDISIVSWMGFDVTDAAHKLPSNANGGNQPAKVVDQYIKAMMSYIPTKNFTIASGLVEVLLDKKALDEEKIALLANENVPKSMIQREILPQGGQPVQVSALWDPPHPVNDLNVGVSANGFPLITFTAAQRGVDYLIMRTYEGGQVQIATIAGGNNVQAQFEDTQYPGVGSVMYSVIPRHSAHYELGNIVTAATAGPVRYTAENKQSGFNIWDFFMGIDENQQETPTTPVVTSAPNDSMPIQNVPNESVPSDGDVNILLLTPP